ncbi:MAG: flagellar basal body rod protein FlgB [Hyphomicrobiales bacterium]|nr:flagellar basal body rod protein FlgB [Hyphomicrobiales bacterium]
MTAIHLFDLAFRRNEWLGAKQAAIAGNIANANTPGFKAQDVEPFSDILNSTALKLVKTASMHMLPPAAAFQTTGVRDSAAWATAHSGNSVSLDQELVKSGEAQRAFSLNSAVVKSFHRILLSASKG